MVSLPLTPEDKTAETKKIIEIGRINGYNSSTIINIIKKHERKKELRDLSTFYADTTSEPVKRYGIRYFPEVTLRLKSIFKEHDFQLVHRNEGTLKQLLGTPKDKLPCLSKSGIYKIVCNQCSHEYFGKTIRSLETRALEHFKSKHWKTKTAVGKHLFNNPTHTSDITNCSLVQEVQNTWKIECYEAIHIHKNKHKQLLNEDLGNIKSSLLNLFTQPSNESGTLLETPTAEKSVYE